MDALQSHIILRCVVGSRAYGLDVDDSDTDIRGVFAPPARLHWALDPVPEQIESDEDQECIWEVEKFIRLALKGNPTILECLYTPIVLEATDLGETLLDIRECFLSKSIYETYRGYADAQFLKMNKSPNLNVISRRKNAMHLIRLLLAGIVALNENRIAVDIRDHRDLLLAIRDGSMNWSDISTIRADLNKQMAAAFAATSLPDKPDRDVANAFLLSVRRGALDW